MKSLFLLLLLLLLEKKKKIIFYFASLGLTIKWVKIKYTNVFVKSHENATLLRTNFMYSILGTVP